jgi:mRNA-degrading endonuclease YafQ of YafQ-DinJ toxin-antitoxin module
MTKVIYTESFKKMISKFKNKNPLLDKIFRKQFKRFKENPCHVGLRLHRLKGKRSSQYAIQIEGDLRALAIKEDDAYIFFDLVKHDEY